MGACSGDKESEVHMRGEWRGLGRGGWRCACGEGGYWIRVQLVYMYSGAVIVQHSMGHENNVRLGGCQITK